jgi:hypothetical protein
LTGKGKFVVFDAARSRSYAKLILVKFWFWSFWFFSKTAAGCPAFRPLRFRNAARLRRATAGNNPERFQKDFCSETGGTRCPTLSAVKLFAPFAFFRGNKLRQSAFISGSVLPASALKLVSGMAI